MYFNLIMELERGNKESLKEFLLKAKYIELFDSSNEDGECLTHYAIMHNSEMKKYYNKRVEQGKHKMCVINIIRNKLLSRIFAVVNRKTPYVDLLAYNT